MEIYTAHGRKLQNPIQILEPAQISVYFKSTGCDSDKPVSDVRAVALTPLDFSISMRNVALVNAILQSISESFEESTFPEESQAVPEILSPNETEHIEQLARTLQSDDPDQSNLSRETSSVTDVSPVKGELSGRDGTVTIKSSSTMSIKITLQETKVTIINDFQGLDDALIRTTFRNMMLGAQLRDGECITLGSDYHTGFNFNLHMSVLADYFDSPSDMWKPLLVEPWEVSSRASRAPNNRSKMLRPSTTVDVESFPCFMRFSEQLLTNLASANNMWQVYATATSSAVDQKSSFSLSKKSLKTSMAASAARNLITSLPYAIENHSGIDIDFIAHSEDNVHQRCENGTIEFFRFDAPRGAGSGGRRLYGKDQTSKKSVSLCIGTSYFKLSDVDAQIGSPRQIIKLSGYTLVLSIRKEEKSTVSIFIIALLAWLWILQATQFKLLLFRSCIFQVALICTIAHLYLFQLVSLMEPV